MKMSMMMIALKCSRQWSRSLGRVLEVLEAVVEES
jgi:hypothetical protein